MKQSPLLTAACATLFLLSTSTSFACSMMGPNTHVGTITSIDSKAQTFTIQDAETNKPITFNADNKIMLELAGINNHQVIVGYAEVDGKLIAANVK
jgi:hypothetical protein